MKKILRGIFYFIVIIFSIVIGTFIVQYFFELILKYTSESSFIRNIAIYILTNTYLENLGGVIGLAIVFLINLIYKKTKNKK